MAGRVHFASLFCVDFDMDLLIHWARHYRAFGYDTYTAYLHTNQDRTKEEMREIRDIFDRYGFSAFWTFGTFREGGLRIECLEPHRALLPPDDYLVVADSDEFHDANPATFKDIIRSHECVEGYLVDCWGEKLVDADPRLPLGEQYPHQGNFKEACGLEGVVHPNRRKILASRCSLAVNFIGSHTMEERRVFRMPGRYHVLHYTFRSSLPERMCGKRYFRSMDLYNLLVYFGQDNHPALQKKLEWEDEIQKEMGWIPFKNTRCVPEKMRVA